MDFEAFVAARGRTLLHHAWTLTGDWHLAEDLVQDALVKAHRRWRRIEAMDGPEAYVRSMIVNGFLSHHRLMRNRERPTGPSPRPDAAMAPSPDVEQRDEVVAALRTLTRAQRAVMVLRYIADWTDDDIARQLGCSASTVRTHADRAKKRLSLTLTKEQCTP